MAKEILGFDFAAEFSGRLFSRDKRIVRNVAGECGGSQIVKSVYMVAQSSRARSHDGTRLCALELAVNL